MPDSSLPVSSMPDSQNKKLPFTVMCSLLLLLVAASGCESDVAPASADEGSIEPDTLYIDNFEEIITTESMLLAQPFGPVIYRTEGEDRLAYFDYGHNQVRIFSTDGELLLEFGSTGGGPGEWEEMSGAGHLSIAGEQIYLTDHGHFTYDLFTTDGDFIRSIEMPRHLNYNDKYLIEENRLLAATNGHEDALAVIVDLENDGEILQHIGESLADPPTHRTLEEERLAYAEGEVPEVALNEALVRPAENGYLLLMNSMGELRFYDLEGDLTFQSSLPEEIKDPIFEFISWSNRENAAPHTVMPLRYIRYMVVADDQIYLLSSNFPQADELDDHLLVYNLDGELIRHLVLVDRENEAVFSGFGIDSSRNLYLTEVMSARVLKTGI